MGPEVILAATIGSALFSGVGAVMQGQAAAQAASYQAAVARNNQIVADQNARYSVAAGEARAQTQSFKNRAVAGTIEAAQSASGLSLDSPTFRDVRESADQIGRLDTATIMQDALLQSRASTQQGKNFEAQAGLYDMQASNASTAGMIGGIGSLLSGAASFSDKWARFYPSTSLGSWSPRP